MPTESAVDNLDQDDDEEEDDTDDANATPTCEKLCAMYFWVKINYF